MAIIRTEIESLKPPSLVVGTNPSIYQPPLLSDKSVSLKSGTLTLDQFAVVEFSGGSETVETFHHDWYYRIHLIPSELNLGNVIADQEREILLWNAYFENKNLNAVNFPNSGGVTIIDPVGSPYTLRPLEAIYYTVNVSGDGPPSIDIRLTWSIPGEDLSVPVIGRRVNLWPFVPDWAGSVVENLEWKTNIVTSFEGREQRLNVRSKARRSFEYQVTNLKANESSMLAALLWGWQNRNYALPLWMDESSLTATANQGAVTVNCDTTNRGFFNEGLIMIAKTISDFEVVEVASFNATSLTLKKPLGKTWQQGSKIYPVNIARITDSVSTQYLTDAVSRSQVRFACDPISTDPYTPQSTPQTLFNGKELFTLEPNWSNNPSRENDYPYEIYDSGTSGVYITQTVRNPIVTFRHRWTVKGKGEVRKIREFLNRRKGRSKTFYCPSWFTDFELHAFENSSAVSIRVKNNEFHRMINLNTGLPGIMIKVPGQPPVYRKILTVSYDLEGFSILGLDGPIQRDLDPNKKPLISLIHHCRLSSDGVTITWPTDSVIILELSLTTVQ